MTTIEKQTKPESLISQNIILGQQINSSDLNIHYSGHLPTLVTGQGIVGTGVGWNQSLVGGTRSGPLDEQEQGDWESIREWI